MQGRPSVVALVLTASACPSPDDPPVGSGAGGSDTQAAEEESTEGDDGPLPKLDIFDDTSTDWMLHFVPDADFTPKWQIVQILLEQPVVRHVCYVEGSEDVPRATSSTFTREDRLMVSTGLELWEVTLPDCVGHRVGVFPEEHTIINGITPDEGNGLYGLSATLGELVAIDPDSGEVTPLGTLDIPLTDTHGATWNDETQQLLVVEGGVDALYEVDPQSVTSTELTTIDHDFHWVGFEYHPHTETMYGCSYDKQVVRIDPDGSTEVYVELEQPCNNLAAPWGDPELPPID